MIRQAFRDALQIVGGFWRFLYAVYKIYRLREKKITIFGGTRIAVNRTLYKDAYRLGALFAADDIAVITGGGPGIMEAALCGAASTDKEHVALGISVKDLDLGFVPGCGIDHIVVADFAMRKRLLIYYSSAFINFPGGVGTLDELLEVMNLIISGKIKRVPVVLVDCQYWKFFLTWFYQAIESGYVSREFHDLVICVDDVETIPALLQK